jgi:hypothetical protein
VQLLKCVVKVINVNSGYLRFVGILCTATEIASVRSLWFCSTRQLGKPGLTCCIV